MYDLGRTDQKMGRTSSVQRRWLNASFHGRGREGPLRQRPTFFKIFITATSLKWSTIQSLSCPQPWAQNSWVMAKFNIWPIQGVEMNARSQATFKEFLNHGCCQVYSIVPDGFIIVFQRLNHFHHVCGDLQAGQIHNVAQGVIALYISEAKSNHSFFHNKIYKCNE